MEIHANAIRIGNSWGFIVPSEVAKMLKLTAKTTMHIELKPIPELEETKGTLKTKKSTAQIMKEIDEGWD